MGTPELSDPKKDLFNYAIEGNLTEVRRIITDSKLLVNWYDEKKLTPLQHAAYHGHYDVCKLLLDCGANVNVNEDRRGYSPLTMAALGNHRDVITLLLDYGANPAVITKKNKTAAEMAIEVGNLPSSIVIKNYVTKDTIEYFTEVHGLESKPKLPHFLCDPVHKFVNLNSIHPVRLTSYLRENNVILENLKHVIDVLKIMAEEQLKENERLSLKLQHYAFVLSSISDFILSQKKESAEAEISDENILDAFIKSLLKGQTLSGLIPISLEKFLRESVSAYPFHSSLRYKEIVLTISTTALGGEPNAFAILTDGILEYEPFNANYCKACGNEGLVKLCVRCKKVRYCDKICQKAHWIIHKNVCKK